MKKTFEKSNRLKHLSGDIDIDIENSINIFDVVFNSIYTERILNQEQLHNRIDIDHTLVSIDYVKAKEKFGKQNGKIKKEVLYKVWKLGYMNYKFLLFCDKPNSYKGSYVNIIGNFDRETLMEDKDIYNATMRLRQNLYNIFKEE